MGTAPTRASLAVLAVTLATLVGCSEPAAPETEIVPGAATSTDGSARSEPQPTAIRGAGTLIVSAESLDDIARWGSSMLVVSVTGEKARSTSPAGPDEVEVGRDLAVRVEEVVWQHPRAVTAVSPGDHLSIYTFPGYVEVDGQRSPAVQEGEVRMDVGRQYVVAMTDDFVDGAQALTLLTTVHLEADAIRLDEAATIPLARATSELEQLSAEDLETGPREGESLIQRVERVGPQD